MKKFISLVLSLVMALSLCVPAWGAATPVTTEGELKAALAAGGEVVLGANITLTTSTSNGNFEIPASAGTVVLNLNGYTITAPDRDGYTDRTQYVFDNYADLSIKGTGTINSRGIQNYGKLTIENGVTVKAVDANGGAGIWAYAGSETIINGGTFTAAEAAGCVNSAGKLTINGGTFTQTQSTAAYCYAINFSGTEGVINNATVNGAHGCVAVTAGTMTVKGGSFTTTGVNAQSDHVLYVSAGAKIVVEDGNFVGDHEAGGTSLYNNASTASVTGGSFSDDVTDYVEPGSTVVIAGDTVAKNSDGSVVVNPVAQVGNTKYETVAAAIAAAGANDVIVLLDTNATIPTGYEAVYTAGKYMVVPKTAAAGTTTVLKNADKYDIYAITGTTSVKAANADITKKVTSNVSVTVGDKTTVTYTATTYSDGANVYVEVDASVADYKLVQNGVIVAYLKNLADVGSVPTTTKVATAFVEAKLPALQVCGDNTVNGYVVDGKTYVAGGANWAVLNGKFVQYTETLVPTVPHDYAVGSYSVKDKTVATVKCVDCKATWNVLTAKQVAAMAPSAYTKLTTGAAEVIGLYIPVTVVSTGITTDKVTSAETFDAGIAMYVGMSIMAAAGSAVVLKKKD